MGMELISSANFLSLNGCCYQRLMKLKMKKSILIIVLTVWQYSTLLIVANINLVSDNVMTEQIHV